MSRPQIEFESLLLEYAPTAQADGPAPAQGRAVKRASAGAAASMMATTADERMRAARLGSLAACAACVLLALCALGASAPAWAVPPYGGTIFLDPDIITSSDPSAFEGVSYAGQAPRFVFDRRVNAFITMDAFLFEAVFADGLTSEVQVNPEFGDPTTAEIEAAKYGLVLGRLPTALRVDMASVTIHRGNEDFGGGNNGLLIHVGRAVQAEASGILEETLVHETSHTSLDADHADAPGWLAAQVADGEFITTYARDFPDREDVAESFLVYLAVQYRRDRLDVALAQTIEQTIPKPTSPLSPWICTPLRERARPKFQSCLAGDSAHWRQRCSRRELLSG